MSDFKTQNTKVKESVDVTDSSTLVIGVNKNMDQSLRVIQNIGNNIVYISFGDDATIGLNGEIVLDANDIYETKFMGDIYGIRNAVAQNNNNITIIAF